MSASDGFSRSRLMMIKHWILKFNMKKVFPNLVIILDNDRQGIDSTCNVFVFNLRNSLCGKWEHRRASLSSCAIANMLLCRTVCSLHLEDVLTACYLVHHSLSAAAPSVSAMEGGHSLHSFINSYQMMFCTLFALLAGTAIIIIGGSTHFCLNCYALMRELGKLWC